MSAQSARVKIDLDQVTGQVDRRIFGGFIEHLGRCIYGGIYDEGSPLSDGQHFRKDVLAALKPLQMPILRWPGGNFVSGYTWTDGIGPVDERPRRLELAWHDVESNRFGTDEYIAYCRELDTEPFICVNMGTGTMEEARSWVEYCNGTSDTYWANLRRENGHPEPYNVKYWGLGNEMWGSWQIGALSADDYVRKAIEFAKVMLWTDPTIELVSCGQNGSSAWDRTVLEGLARFIRYHSIHIYTGNADYTENVYQPHIAEWELDNMRAEIDRVRMQQGTEHEIKVAYDEWNVWYRAHQPERLEEKYDLSDALAVAAYLNVFVRQADVVTVANLAQMVNVIAPIFTSAEGLYLQTIYHPLALLAEHTQEVALSAWVDGPTVTLPNSLPGQEKPSRAAKLGAFNVLDVAATRDDARSTLTVSLINRSKDEDLDVALELSAGEVTGEIRRFEVNGDDVHGINDFDHPENVRVIETMEQQSGRLVRMHLPAHSHTVVRMATKPTA
ncbi:MAG: alpha-N-arabinofuranosidase [Chloroflexia bacterium]|nr:alpha-N-arabinofuranosidase [Chloroflexia bacterium]